MAKQIQVRRLRLGGGRPKICVPLVSDTSPALLAEARAALEAGAQILELRADFMAAALRAPVEKTADSLCAAAGELRAAIGETPLIFTLRGQSEGGQCPFDGPQTALLLEEAAKSGAVDLLDVELFLGNGLCERVIQTARQCGVKAIASHHRFDMTPGSGEMLDILRACEAVEAHIAKLAVMPLEPADVLALLSATDAFRREGGMPAITMSMGALGAVSRLCGEAFGSCLTFGAGQNASAPGQIEARKLAGMLDALRVEE